MYLEPYKYLSLGCSLPQIDPPSIQTTATQHSPLNRPGRMGRRTIPSSALNCLNSLPSKSESCMGYNSCVLAKPVLRILNMAMKVRKSAYSDVTELDLKLYVFALCSSSAKTKAAQMRLRTEYTLLPSLPSSAIGHAVSISSAGGGDPGISGTVPEVTGYLFPGLTVLHPYHSSPKWKLTDPIQQTNLALNVSETIINLHRPYYAKALYDVDSVESIYKPSFYTIIERCGVSIQRNNPPSSSKLISGRSSSALSLTSTLAFQLSARGSGTYG